MIKARKEDIIKLVTESMVKVVENVSDTKRLQDVPGFIEHIKNQFLCMGEEYGNKKNTEAYSPRILRLELAVWSSSKMAYEYLRKSKMVLLPHSGSFHRGGE